MEIFLNDEYGQTMKKMNQWDFKGSISRRSKAMTSRGFVFAHVQ